MKYVIKKADIALGIFLAVLCAMVSWYVYSSGSSGSYAAVTVNGQAYGTYSLAEDQETDIDSEYGHNRLTVSGGRILMTEASCPDGYCLNQHKKNGGMKDSNQTIVCLPNRVAVSILTGEKTEKERGQSDGIYSDSDAVAGAAGGGPEEGGERDAEKR